MISMFGYSRRVLLAAIDLIPNAWETGPLPEVIMLGAFVAAVGAIVRMVVVPIVRWIRRLVIAIETTADRLASIPEHDDRIDIIEQQITEIVEALRPTNGDRRSISDRLDSVKQQTIDNTTHIVELSSRIDNLTKDRRS